MTGSPLARRRRTFAVVAAAAALASTAGVVASTAVRSPAQVAADTAAPPASLLTAEVIRKVLSATLVMRGTFTGGRRYEFTPGSVARTANGPGGSNLVVTAVRTSAGAAVTPGAVLAEVSERPIFALAGAFPAYRDMLPGQSGKDIAQLQAGLARVGFRGSDRSGYFGPGTQGAVRRFYAARGYAVPLTDAAGAGQSTAAPGGSGGGSGAGRGPAGGAPDKPGGTTDPSPGPSVSASPGAKTIAGAFRMVVDPAPVPMVPMSEVVFLPDQPARVAAFAAQVGDAVKAPFLAFGVDGLSMSVRLDPANAPLVKVGTDVTVLSETSGFTGTGVVNTVGPRTTDANGGGVYIPLAIAPGAAWPQDLEGQDARVTITTASTEGEVLAVPVAAISAAADGRTTVSVVAGDGGRHPVEVKAGVSADGWVEVSPVGGAGELRPGDRVVTGT